MDCRLALVYSDEDRGRAGDVKALGKLQFFVLQSKSCPLKLRAKGFLDGQDYLASV